MYMYIYSDLCAYTLLAINVAGTQTLKLRPARSACHTNIGSAAQLGIRNRHYCSAASVST